MTAHNIKEGSGSDSTIRSRIILLDIWASRKEAERIASEKMEEIASVRDFISGFNNDQDLLAKVTGKMYWVNDAGLRSVMTKPEAEGNTMFCRIDRGNCSIEPVSDRKWSAVIPREDRAYARIGNGHLAVYFGSRFGSMQISTDTSLNRFAMVALVKHRTVVPQNTDQSVLDCMKGCVR